MARASGCIVEIDVGGVPVLEGALDLLAANTPGGARTNQEHFGVAVDLADRRATAAAVNCCSIRRRRVGFSWRWLADRADEALRAFSARGCRSGPSAGSWPALVVCRRAVGTEPSRPLAPAANLEKPPQGMV